MPSPIEFPPKRCQGDGGGSAALVIDRRLIDVTADQIQLARTCWIASSSSMLTPPGSRAGRETDGSNTSKIKGKIDRLALEFFDHFGQARSISQYSYRYSELQEEL